MVGRCNCCPSTKETLDRAETPRWHELVWGEGIVPRHFFILWLAMRRRLSTHGRLVQMGLLSSNLCSLQGKGGELRPSFILIVLFPGDWHILGKRCNIPRSNLLTLPIELLGDAREMHWDESCLRPLPTTFGRREIGDYIVNQDRSWFKPWRITFEIRKRVNELFFPNQSGAGCQLGTCYYLIEWTSFSDVCDFCTNPWHRLSFFVDSG